MDRHIQTESTKSWKYVRVQENNESGRRVNSAQRKQRVHCIESMAGLELFTHSSNHRASVANFNFLVRFQRTWIFFCFV